MVKAPAPGLPATGVMVLAIDQNIPNPISGHIVDPNLRSGYFKF